MTQQKAKIEFDDDRLFCQSKIIVYTRTKDIEFHIRKNYLLYILVVVDACRSSRSKLFSLLTFFLSYIHTNLLDYCGTSSFSQTGFNPKRSSDTVGNLLALFLSASVLLVAPSNHTNIRTSLYISCSDKQTNTHTHTHKALIFLFFFFSSLISFLFFTSSSF